MGYVRGLGRSGGGVRELAGRDSASFWEGQARLLDWHAPWDRALRWDPPRARWFEGGRINACYNALDRHADKSKTAILWEAEDGSSRSFSYSDLLSETERVAGALSSMGVSKGDRVAIYLPMVPELPVSMLACARIGAVHAVVFSGFGAAALRQRLEDSGARALITADGMYRRGRAIPLKPVADEAARGLPVESTVVVRRTGQQTRMGPRDLWWDELEGRSPALPVESSHPLFILYTSGTTGKPKGILHGTGGYLTHVHSTFRWAFDIRDEDVYWCTADIGWVTGHSYAVYGPLMCGATQVIYEGAPDHPTPERPWQIASKRGATILYTTPTALRMLMRRGDPPSGCDLSRLRLLGTVGEPINPEVWRWYHDSVGGRRCPVIDTWWQTETGGMMVSALPGIEDADPKPGSAGFPVPGVRLSVLDGDGAEAGPGERGYLTIDGPWPGMMLTVWGDEERYEQYWSKYPGRYYAGDYAVRDQDGYLWVLGRADDVLKVSGHRLGTAELESALVSHPGVAEAAVCGVPDEVRGEAIAAFAVLREGASCTGEELVEWVRQKMGAVAAPSRMHIVPRLPKTRSGKIMRRLLRDLAEGREAGDTSTIEDPGAVSDVRAAIKGRDRA